MSDAMDKPTTDPLASAKPLRAIRSYVLRGGRMTEGQNRAVATHWPSKGLEVKNGLLDLEQTFNRRADTVLEIGFGMGQSLAEMAANALETNFIGVEVHRPGVGKLLHTMGEQGIENIRVYCDDAVDVLAHCIADNSLQRIQIYFPDPWHKKKHNKRRLIQAEFVQKLRRKLVIGGVLHLATDWQHYAEQMMEVMTAAEGFTNTRPDGEYAPRPDYRPITKFEKRGERLGHGVWDLLFKRES